MSVICARSVIFSGYTAFSSVNIRGWVIRRRKPKKDIQYNGQKKKDKKAKNDKQYIENKNMSCYACLCLGSWCLTPLSTMC
jgi:hypothetical protein